MAIVTVVEPHALLRFGILRHLTDVLPELQIKGVDYSSLSEHAPCNTESDLVLLSVTPHENAAELTKAAQRAYAPKWIVLSSDVATMPHSWQDLPTTVAGYVPKRVSPDVLAATIRVVLAGGKCFQSVSCGPHLAAPLPELPAANEDLMAVNALSTSLATTEAQMLGITARQYEVLVLLARGYPLKAVSRQLNIAIATAKAHTESLYQRLDAHSRNQAVYMAISHGATLGWKAPTLYSKHSQQS